jgi:hypothetical protein
MMLSVHKRRVRLPLLKRILGEAEQARRAAVP